MEGNALLVKYTNSGDILQDMRDIIEVSRDSAYQAVNLALVRRNWMLGRRIAEEELNGESRAEYGLEIIKKLSKELTEEFGKGYTKTNLYNFYLFYKSFPEIFHAASGKSVSLLSWTHYRTLLQVKDEKARAWYEKETVEQTWSVRTLLRMFDELKRSEGDNPTLGIVLCSETDDDIARYSVMHGSEQLFASKYKLYLPTEDELRAEIEAQKAMFYLQQKETTDET